MITINGIDWEPVPGAPYKRDYAQVAEAAKRGVWFDGTPCTTTDVCRAFILNDLWFLLYFGMGYKTANHPFVVSACREVEDGPQDYTLDVFAREHFKSSIITKAETIQFALRNPDKSTGIFSYIKPLAKKFLFEIKETLDSNRFLNECFPDVLWGVGRSGKEAPLWALDEGIILKRKTNMAEPTVSAWGLTEGMPVGMHFDRRVYDDISTEDMSKSIDMMEAVKTKFDSSQNIGKEGGHHRVVGTYYHHSDPLVYIREKKGLDGKPKYSYRLKPATHDGTAMGRPVLLSQKRLDDLKGDRTFNFQQLCNPTPESDQRLDPNFLVTVEAKSIPKNLNRYMLVDQAGDLDSNKSKDGDSWAVAVVGVEPVMDDLGQSNVYIEDLWVEPSSESAAIEQIVRMYLRAGILHQLCVEKVGISTTHIHIANALCARGRHVSFDEDVGTGVLLRPAGRNKKKFIEGALSWPLNNSKIHISDAVPAAYRERLKMEMENFPLWHDDALNVLAYTYDVLRDTPFPMYDDDSSEDITIPQCSMLID